MSYFLNKSILRPMALGAIGLLLSFPHPAWAGSYWYGFSRFWTDYFGRQNGVVMAALLVGVLAIFIVTRGKWKK